MNIKPIRRYRSRLSRTSGLFKNNPVIALGLTLPFVIVPAMNIKSGLLMSAFLAAATIPAATLAPVLHKRVYPMMLLPCLSMISVLLVMTLRYAFIPYVAQVEDLGVYVPLAALNGMMLELALLHPRKKFSTALYNSVMMCLGFALVACFVGALREFFANGTLWGIAVSSPIKVRGLALPFAGFILIGFLSALFRRIDHLIVVRMLARPVAQPIGEAGDRL